MRQITYKEGEYSQIRLDDGRRLYIETLPQKVRIKKMFIGFIPTETLWVYTFPFYIRTFIEPFETAKEILNLTIRMLSDSKYSKELPNLFEKLNSTLSDYVKTNENRAQKIAMDKLGYISLKAVPDEKIIKKVEGLLDELEKGDKK